MIQALLSSVGSIQAQQSRMNVIGDDLANINTTGFKSQDLNFETLISQQYAGASAPNGKLGGTDGIQVGLGVKVGTTTTNLSQGTLSATANPSDLAIEGNGYFMTSNGTGTSYTRDGNFTLDQNGTLVSADTGQNVLGWSADGKGVLSTTTSITPASSLKIPIGSLDASQATSTATLGGALSSTAATTDTGTTTTTVYDSLGNPHDVTIVYSNPTTPPPTTPTPPTGATSSWNWTAYSGDTGTGTAIGSSSSTGNAPIYFNASGQEVSGLASGVLNQITVPAAGSATATTLGLDMSQISGLGTTTSIDVATQNGYPAGTLNSYSISDTGQITGSFTNGMTQTLGQVALATFTNPSALTSVGSNLFSSSPNSGVPMVSAANTGGAGSISSGYLEQSNVDLSQSLTDLIITQRGFEANTKMVTTVDTMLQDVIDMKR